MVAGRRVLTGFPWIFIPRTSTSSLEGAASTLEAQQKQASATIWQAAMAQTCSSSQFGASPFLALILTSPSMASFKDVMKHMEREEREREEEFLLKYPRAYIAVQKELEKIIIEDLKKVEGKNKELTDVALATRTRKRPRSSDVS